MSEKFMEAPCQHCPFRRDVKPFLHPDRAAEISSAAENPYSSFPCHKTLEYDETYDSEDDNGLYIGEQSKECAGALYMKAMANGSTWYDDDGFKPNPEWNCYEDSWEMEEAYSEAWERDQ